MKLAIVDYGVGNIQSILNAFDRLGLQSVKVSKNKNELSKFNNGLREVLINSDLCNAKIFAKKFENLIENILINHK